MVVEDLEEASNAGKEPKDFLEMGSSQIASPTRPVSSQP
jgi:hypothetical protein